MSTLHKEIEFEDAIEADLVERGGWLKGNRDDFDPATALDSKQFFTFIETTQNSLWEALRKQHGSGLEEAVIDSLAKSLDQFGTLDALRRGIKFFGKQIDLAYFRPSHKLNPDILQLR